MKRLILALAFVAFIIGGVSGLNLNFQNPSDFTSYISCYGSSSLCTCSWIESPTGGNNYVYLFTGYSWGTCEMMNADASQTKYAAATSFSAAYEGNKIRLYSSDMTVLATFNAGIGRYEVKVIGGDAYVYKNGILESGPTAIATNPSYIGFGGAGNPVNGGISTWDDFVYGSSENQYVFGQPESDAFIIKKDMINPASYGLAYTNGTVVNSNNMTSTWARSNYSAEGDPETVVLRRGMGTASSSVVASASTGNASTGSIAWDLNSAFFNNDDAQYGGYYTTIHNTDQYSNIIFYLASGATIAFDKDDYSEGETAVLTYEVTDGYWTSDYSYKIAVMDAYGTFVSNQSITTQTGSKTYTWASDDATGVYYGIVIATATSTGTEYWMNYDYAELNDYVYISGYVMDQDGTLLEGANVSATQGTTTAYNLSLPTGAYLLSQAFESNMVLTINTTLTGYADDSTFFTALAGGTITNRNITLVATNHSYTGTAIGGVARSSQYNGTLPAVTVYGINSTYGESYTNITNIAGWYLMDENADIILTSARTYDLWGQKTGFNPARNYTVVAP